MIQTFRRQNITFETRGRADAIGNRPRPNLHKGNSAATRTGAAATTTSTNSTTGAPATTKATDAARESHTTPTPGRKTPPGGETDPSPNENLKTQDIPLQADKEAGMGMTVLPLVVTEETMAMKGTRVTKGTMVMERTMVMGRTVVTVGTVQRAMAVGTTARMGTVMVTMGMRSPGTVTEGHVACHQAKRGMPPQKTRHLRQKKYRQRTPERRGLWSPSHLAKAQARGRERSLAASFRDSSRLGRILPALA